MNDAPTFDILTSVKTNLGLLGNDYHDDTLVNYIAEVKQFLLDAGVKPEIVDAESSVGIISRGVSDLWNYGAGNASLSPYFMQRAIQLCCKRSGGTENGQ